MKEKSLIFVNDATKYVLRFSSKYRLFSTVSFINQFINHLLILTSIRYLIYCFY